MIAASAPALLAILTAVPQLIRKLRHDLGYGLLRAVLAAGAALPLPVLRAAGRALALVAWGVAAKDRRRAREHVARAFPEESEAARRALLSDSRSHLGRLLGEVLWLWSAPPAAILARTEFAGLEHLTGPLEASGVVLVTAHCGNWEWMNLALGAAGVPMSMATREVYDPRIDAVAIRLRGRFGGVPVARGRGAGGRLLADLKQRRVVGLLIDQDIETPGVFVEFFGSPAWTPSGAAVLALRARVPVVAGFAQRLRDGRMRLAFDPPLAFAASGDLETDTARLTAILTARIEAQIRSRPPQWVWMHRRWRRRPAAGELVWRADGAARPAADPAG